MQINNPSRCYARYASRVLFARRGWSLCVLAGFVLASYLPIVDAVGETSGSGLQEVIVVFKTHFDIGYTDLAPKVVESYRTTMMDKALAIVDESEGLPTEQRFVWTLPGWPMAQILGTEQTPERRDRVMAALRSGRFVTHALPFTLHTESLDLEDLVRGMGFSSAIARSLGQDLPRDAKMTDVPSHSWVMPTLLKHAGVEFLHVGCNAASASPEVPRLFWWEGPDGSRLLTMYTAEAYGTGLTPPKDWAYPVWLALIHTGDNEGPPKPDAVTKLLEDARQTLPGVRVRMGRLSDFSDALMKYASDAPVVRGDMPDTWIHGVMSMPIETGMARRDRLQLAGWESLNTLLQGWKVTGGDDSGSLARAYADSLLYGEHTWGMDVKRFGKRVYGSEWEKVRAKGRYQKLEDSWADKGGHIHEMDQLLEAGLSENLSRLAKAIKTEGPRIVVYNPLPWARDGLVEVDLEGNSIESIKDLESGETFAPERQGKKLVFIARQVPAMGYRTYGWVSESVVSENGAPTYDLKTDTLENEFFRIVLDMNRGAIQSFVDKRTGRDWVNPASEPGFGQYLQERFSAVEEERYVRAYAKIEADWVRGDFGKPGIPSADQAGYSSATLQCGGMEIVQGVYRASVTLKASAGSMVPEGSRFTVTLYRGLPYVDIAWAVENKKPDPWPESGWLCLPLAIGAPEFRLGRLGGIVDPKTEVLLGANHDMYCLNTGLAVLGEGRSGIGICPLDTPLVSLGRPGSWRYSREYLPTEANVFVNLFNNQWSTNFEQWIGGTWSSTVRLWTIDGYDAESDLITPALEARMPLQAAACEGAAGTLPLTGKGVELSRKGVMITAFGKNPDGEGIVFRLWEQAGKGGACGVQFPEGFRVKSVQPCDLRGRVLGDPVEVCEGRLDVDLAAYAPASFLLTQP